MGGEVCEEISVITRYEAILNYKWGIASYLAMTIRIISYIYLFNETHITMIRYIRLLTVFIFCCLNAFSQVSFYADSFTGGVTAGGYAPDCGGSGTGVISVNIPAGSTIRKAWLFSGRQGLAPSVTVELNGTSLTFDSLNQVSPTFQSFFYGGNSGVHAIDVTSIVSAADTSYILEVPTQNAVSDRFTDFYLIQLLTIIRR